MIDMENRIKQCRLDAGIKTQTELAAMVGLTRAAISALETGVSKPSGETLLKLASIFGVSEKWLLTGRGHKQKNSPLHSNIVAAKDFGLCPVLNSVQAGEFTDIADIYEPGYAEEWMPCPIKHGLNTFILRVEGESMYNPQGPKSFRPGDYIFVDPTIQATSGSLVVVRQEHSKAATFKQLILDGGKCYLKALNPAWPNQIIEIDCDTQIVGVVILKMEKM